MLRVTQQPQLRGGCGGSAEGGVRRGSAERTRGRKRLQTSKSMLITLKQKERTRKGPREKCCDGAASPLNTACTGRLKAMSDKTVSVNDIR